MVQGRVVRPLVMASQPSSKQPTQKHQSQKKSRQHKSDRRRSSHDNIHTHDKDFENIVDSYNHHHDRRSRRYDRLPSKKKTTTISRMKTTFENSLPIFKNSSNKFRHSSLDDEDNLESQQQRRYNKQHFRKREHRLSPQEHKWPFQIPPFATLSQRADLWIITAISSCVSLASFAQLTSSFTDTLSTTKRRFAFSTTVISFIIAFVLGAAFRHAPFRHAFTRSLISRKHISLELLLVSILSILWMIAIPIIVDGFNSIGQDPLAVYGMEIWNANLYYSSWISVLLVGYIFIELITSTDRYGTVSATASSSWKENTFSKRLVLLTFTSAVVLSVSVSVHGGSPCDGEILMGTVYCRKALFGILVGGFLQLFLCCCVGIAHRLRSMDYTISSAAYYYDSRGGSGESNRRYMRKKMSVWKREQYSLYFGMLSLLVQSVNVALLTNPVESGPGNSSGSLYFASWISFFLVVEMCLRYLELYTTSAGRKVKRKSKKAPNDDADHSEVTYDSDEDEIPPVRQSSVIRILRKESLGSRSSSGAPVYEEVNSFSTESPRYGIQQTEFKMQPLLPPAPSPPDDANQRLLGVNDGPMRSTLEPEAEEEEKVSPNSGSFAESVRDFSIGSRKMEGSAAVQSMER